MATLGRLTCGMALLWAAQSDLVGGPLERNYITPEDTKVQLHAQQVMMEACRAGGFVGEISGTREELLEDLGGENPVDTLAAFMEEANKTDGDILALAQEKYPVDWAVGKVWMFVMAIFAFTTWSFCCWTAWPCCRPCRCGEKEKQQPIVCKLAFLTVSILVLVACGCMVLTTRKAAGEINDGFDNLLCGSAKLLHTTLAGSTEEPKFLGMMPMLKEIENLDAMLDNNSALLVQLDSIIDQTKAIENDLVLVPEVLGLLGEMMGNLQNVRPHDDLGKYMLHNCTFCTQMAEPILEASNALATSAPQAIQDARKEVKSQLSPANRAKLQDELRKSAQDMISLKEKVREQLAPIVDPDVGIQDAKAQISQVVEFAILEVLLVGCLLAIFGICSTGCWIAQKTPESSQNYSRAPHRCACITWCLLFGAITNALILSGLLHFILIPAGSACIALDDLDGNTFTKLGLGDNPMLVTIADSCFAGKGNTTNLMDIVTIEVNATTGEKATLREMLISSVVDPIEAAFKNINTSGNVGIANDASFGKILDQLINIPMDAALTTDGDAIVNGANATNGWVQYQGILASPETRVGVVTSARCGNFTVTKDNSTIEIPGISNFVDGLKQTGTGSSVVVGCVEQVDVCSVAPPDAQACVSGNSYMDLKAKLVDPANKWFRCDLFEDSLGALCDPKDMVQSTSGNATTYSNDCLVATSGGQTMRTKARNCSLDEYVQYMQDMKPRLEMVLSRLDNTTSEVFTNIVTDLQALVDDFMVDPLNEIANGIDCEFLGTFLQDSVNAFCYQSLQGVKGVANSYLVVVALEIILAIAMYIVWRLSIDSYNKRQDTIEACRLTQ